MKADRYFCLSQRLDASFCRLVAGERAIAADDLAALRRAAILNASGSLCAVAPAGLAAAEQELRPGQGTADLLLSASWSQWRLQQRLRRWSFQRVMTVEAGRAPRQSVTASRPDGLARLHGAFGSIAAWFGEADQCLARSLAFRALALRQGAHPRLVLGVKLDPFAAHCWVQSGTRVDNDVIERTRLYTPILIL
ncbi:hypothetical protein FHS96_005205 [Sphingomonas zeicaulis]|uniref:lasso peptide biosynthesis B2 protein n=1 Tax=Sphingomonas zeicaulis TaxID=1632740 RepID=UPI003D1FE26C